MHIQEGLAWNTAAMSGLVLLQSLTEYMKLFYVLAKFPFASNERELGYHQQLNVRVVTAVT